MSAVTEQLEKRSPSEILEWAFGEFGDEVALATGFGPSGTVLLHLVSRIRSKTTVFYLDTDFLFPETYRLRDELRERLGLTFTRVATDISPREQERQYGPALWQSEPDRCCDLRKVQPLREFLATQSAWITGIRRDQSPLRRRIEIVDWDDVNQVVKICPLATWTADDVWAYLRMHELPYNPLHDLGYPSLGCTHCTRPVQFGEDERAGRWAGRDKTECGIHFQTRAA